MEASFEANRPALTMPNPRPAGEPGNRFRVAQESRRGNQIQQIQARDDRARVSMDPMRATDRYRLAQPCDGHC